MFILLLLLLFIPLSGCSSSSTHFDEQSRVVAYNEKIHTYNLQGQPIFQSYDNLAKGPILPHETPTQPTYQFGMRSDRHLHDRRPPVRRSWNKFHLSPQFPEIVSLYKNGRLDTLNEMRDSIGFFGPIFNQRLSDKRDYIYTLLDSSSGQHLERLARILAIHSPQRMRALLDQIFKETFDPEDRCIALILADKQTGGGNFILNGYLPRKLHSTPDCVDTGAKVYRDFKGQILADTPQAQNIVDTEMAKYALERFLPTAGSPLTPEVANAYVQKILQVARQVNPDCQKEVVVAGILGFYSKFVNPAATIDSHKAAFRQVSNHLIKSIAQAGGQKVGFVPAGIACAYNDVHWLINDCSVEELSYKLGERVGDAAYLVACCVDKTTVMREKKAADQRVAPNTAAQVTTVVTIQPGFVQEPGIFCDAMVAPKALTDFCISGPSNIINISPEIDAQIQQRLSKLSVEERRDLDRLSDSVGALLFEMQQAGELTPSVLDAHAKKLRSYINKITLENVGYVCANIVKGQLNRITDPKAIAADCIKGHYAVLKFVIEVNCCQDYMSSEQRREHFENSLEAFTEIVDGLKSMTLEQTLQLGGAMSIDTLALWGIPKMIGCMRDIGTASRISGQFNRVANAFERQFIASKEQLAAIENVIVNCPKEIVIESSVLNKASTLKNEVEVVNKISQSSRAMVKPGRTAADISDKVFRQKVSQLHPKLAAHIDSIEALEMRVIESAKKLPEQTINELQTILTPSNKIAAMEKEAIDFYNKIAVLQGDSAIIAKNTGIPENIIQQIKCHVFLEEHILDMGIARFHPDIDMSRAWKRLLENNYAAQDLLWLQHEYVESLIMEGTSIPWREAHDTVNKIYNWYGTLK